MDGVLPSPRVGLCTADRDVFWLAFRGLYYFDAQAFGGTVSVKGITRTREFSHCEADCYSQRK